MEISRKQIPKTMKIQCFAYGGPYCYPLTKNELRGFWTWFTCSLLFTTKWAMNWIVGKTTHFWTHWLIGLPVSPWWAIIILNKATKPVNKTYPAIIIMANQKWWIFSGSFVERQPQSPLWFQNVSPQPLVYLPITDGPYRSGLHRVTQRQNNGKTTRYDLGTCWVFY